MVSLKAVARGSAALGTRFMPCSIDIHSVRFRFPGPCSRQCPAQYPRRFALWRALALAGGGCGFPGCGAFRCGDRPRLADPARSEASRKLDESRDPAHVLAFAGFAPGQVVADWGAGGGYSELIADLVGPRGAVYALSDPAYLKPGTLDVVARAMPMCARWWRQAAMALPPASLDAIFAHLEFHDLYAPATRGGTEPARPVAQVLANWFAALRPGGMVVIVDHVGLPGNPAVVGSTVHRIDPAQVKADMAAAGFVLDGESDILQRNDDHTAVVFAPGLRGKTDRFVLRFRRPG
jgi:predicted methyltransferase